MQRATIGAAAIVAAIVATSVGVVLARDDEKKRESPIAAGEYAGVKTCKKCHFKDFKTWKDTNHAKAFDNLPDKYKGDPACLGCHTTGHGQKGGFESAAATADLGGVQCEMCHGPGAEHAAYAKSKEKEKDDPAVIEDIRGRVKGEGGKSACWKCHLDQTHGKHPEFDK